MMVLMLGITRSILRCSDAVAMRPCTESSIRPIRISRIGGDQIVHDGIPLFLHCIPMSEISFVSSCFHFPVVKHHRRGRFATPPLTSSRHTVDRFTIGRCRSPILRKWRVHFQEYRRCGLKGAVKKIKTINKNLHENFRHLFFSPESEWSGNNFLFIFFQFNTENVQLIF